MFYCEEKLSSSLIWALIEFNRLRQTRISWRRRNFYFESRNMRRLEV